MFVMRLILPQTENVLQEKTYAGDTDPAAESHDKWFATCFDKFNNVGIQSDGCHCKDDKELGQILDRAEEISADTTVYSNRCDDGCCNKVQDKKWEDLL